MTVIIGNDHESTDIIWFKNFRHQISNFEYDSLSLRRQVLHDQLLLNLPRAGRQQG